MHTVFYNLAMKKGYHQIDYLLLIIVLVLIGFGLIMITSIGVPKSIRLSAPGVLYPDCGSPEVDCYLIFKNHVLRLLIGLGLFLAALKINYHFWRKIALPFFIFAFILLITVLFFGVSYETFARSWINFPDLPVLSSIQPSEIAKLALIFYFAHWLTKKSQEKEIGTFQSGFLAFCVVLGLIITPIIFQPDLGSTLVISAIAVIMYFTAGARLRHILLGVFIAFLISLVVISNVSYLKNRFSAFLHPSEECEENYCWQSEQAKIAVGSGGFWGKGLTQGIQKSYWLPQATDDFIFAASAEELGFFRIIFIVFLYFFLAWRGLQVAGHAPNQFARLTAVGITTFITAQAFLNIAVNTALFPVTGVTLPFVSYGGTSLVTCLIGMGVLLNISKYTTAHAYTPHGRRDRGPRFAQYRRH